jgi:maltooligosyltrehalose trehalohydrolase
LSATVDAREKETRIWRLDFGANPTEGGVLFRAWAPLANQLSACITHPRPAILPMERDADDVFTAFAELLPARAEYYFELNGDRRRPDPVSRFQPHGVHGASQVVDRDAFAWTDRDWTGIALEDFIIYELHIGTFTSEGTFDGAIGMLPYLRELGITALELMPVAAFPGRRNWGYDGVYLYAPHAAYGGPTGLKRLIDACHSKGMAVVLDVVYNHLGPEGNYLGEYAPCFTDVYRTPWGTAINFDGPQSDGVRRLFIDNALYWLTEYHIDALRLDAIHRIYDFGAHHVLREMAEAFQRQAHALGRKAWLIAESDLNDPRVINPAAIGGHGIDTQWNDDFHHSLHTLLTAARHGYFVDFGRIEDLRKAIVEGFVYDGRRSAIRGESGPAVRRVQSESRPDSECGRRYAPLRDACTRAAEACGGDPAVRAEPADAFHGRRVRGLVALRLFHQLRRPGLGPRGIRGTQARIRAVFQKPDFPRSAGAGDVRPLTHRLGGKYMLAA